MNDKKNSLIIPVILCGGSGTRLWPLSRKAYPKQLLPLMSDRSMLQETLFRLESFTEIAPPMVICNEEHRFMVAEQLQSMDLKNPSIILEPVGKNTAPAAAIAAIHADAQNTDPLLLVLPADHAIKNVDAFCRAIAEASDIAQAGDLVVFGVKPHYPETGYGYIKKGELLSSKTSYKVQAFVEKPNAALAEEYLASGDYFWNSGMFMFRASTYLSELEKFAPDILQACRDTMTALTCDLDFIRLNKTLFDGCRSDSIDYAVMEKSKRVSVIPLDVEWSDLGSWNAVWEAKKQDDNGNVLHGDVHVDNVSNSYIHAENRLLAVVGVTDHIIVETSDAVLVANKKSSQDVKTLVQMLEKKKRSETESHSRVYRPWGFYDVIDISNHFQVKRISIKPGAQLSLQSHRFRSEHWIVVSGIANVICAEAAFELDANQSTYIPMGAKHQLKNLHSEWLVIIEVQTGSYLGEDDILRYQDVYGRATLTT